MQTVRPTVKPKPTMTPEATSVTEITNTDVTQPEAPQVTVTEVTGVTVPVVEVTSIDPFKQLIDNASTSTVEQVPFTNGIMASYVTKLDPNQPGDKAGIVNAYKTFLSLVQRLLEGEYSYDVFRSNWNLIQAYWRVYPNVFRRENCARYIDTWQGGKHDDFERYLAIFDVISTLHTVRNSTLARRQVDFDKALKLFSENAKQRIVSFYTTV